MMPLVPLARVLAAGTASGPGGTAASTPTRTVEITRTLTAPPGRERAGGRGQAPDVAAIADEVLPRVLRRLRDEREQIGDLTDPFS